MRIVSWNCKVGFNAEKAKFIKTYNADLYVIQECTELNLDEVKEIFKYKAVYCDYIDSKYGVGLFSNKFAFKILPEHNKNFRYIVPYRIFNEEREFVLFSVWTKNKDEHNKDIEYTEQTWRAINHDEYQKYLEGSIIILGDFNSTDKLKQKPPHRQIIDKLAEYGIESAYHKHNHCVDDSECEPTLLWKMNKNNKFHIDYCCISSDYKLNDIKVGTLEEWEESKLSDHCPLIMDFE